MLAKIAGHPTTVWIVGSSIVRDGFIEAKMQPGGINLSLKKRLGVSIWWQGRGGLTLRKLKNHIRLLMRLEDTPDYVVIHIGGNGIRDIRVGHFHYLLVRFMSWLTLHYLLVRSMSWLTQMMPQTGLIWSAILPRLTWKYSENNDRMEKCRRRLNSSMGLHMVRHGSYYIKYPEIKADRRFLKTDGVHLTKIGNQVFLNILQGTIEQFVKSKVGGLTFPDLY